MSRLEAVAKGLYYPTPDPVTAAIAAHLAPALSLVAGQVFALLDPCAGTGLALAALARVLPGAVTYGIELNDERGRAAAQVLDHALTMDAYRVALGRQGYSALFLNPPYDTSGEVGGRLEHEFLTAFTRVLAPGGLLIFVVPQAILRRSARYLVSNYHTIQVWRFPDPQFAVFQQVVLVATRRGQVLPTVGWADGELAALAEADLPVLPATPMEEAARWPIPPVAAGPTFRPAIFDADVARRAVAGPRGGWAALTADCWPGPARPAIRPLMPLREGHVALLLQGGALDGMVLTGTGGRQVVVKGTTRKTIVKVETPDAVIDRERVVSTLWLMDTVDGTFTVVGEPTTQDTNHDTRQDTRQDTKEEVTNDDGDAE